MLNFQEKITVEMDVCTEKLKKLMIISNNLKKRFKDSEKEREKLREENNKLKIRSAANFDDLTPRYLNIKGTLEEFKIDKNSRKINSVEFIEALIAGIRERNTEIEKLQIKLDQLNKEYKQAKIKKNF